MKRIVPLALLGAALLLLACAHSYKYKNEATFNGKTVVKSIVVPGKLVNIVVK